MKLILFIALTTFGASAFADCHETYENASIAHQTSIIEAERIMNADSELELLSMNADVEMLRAENQSCRSRVMKEADLQMQKLHGDSVADELNVVVAWRLKALQACDHTMNTGIQDRSNLYNHRVLNIQDTYYRSCAEADTRYYSDVSLCR